MNTFAPTPTGKSRRDGPKVSPDFPLTDADLASVVGVRRLMIAKFYLPVRVNGPWSLLTADPAGRGKAPLGKGWQQGQPEWQLCPKHLDDWLRAACNTGLLCGVGEHPIQALDADVDDPEASAALSALAARLLPHGAMARYRDGSSRWLLVYRCEPGVPKRVVAGAKGKLERLGAGQQFVAHGWHPSGSRLRWLDGKAPSTVRASDLPLLTETQVEAFLDAVRQAGVLGETVAATGGNGPTGTLGPTPRMRELVRAHGGLIRPAMVALLQEACAGAHCRHDTLGAVVGCLIAHCWTAKEIETFLLPALARALGDAVHLGGGDAQDDDAVQGRDWAAEARRWITHAQKHGRAKLVITRARAR